MEKELLMKDIVKYFEKNYGDKIDTVNMPLKGGMIAYLGIDSFQSLEILIDMETLFNISITDDILSYKLMDDVEYMADTFSSMLCKK